MLSVLSSAPLAWLIEGDLQLVQMGLILAALVWVRHASNIRRLLSGQEPKIGKK